MGAHTRARTQTFACTRTDAHIFFFSAIDRTNECVVIYCTRGQLLGGAVMDCHHFPKVKA